MEFKEKLKNPGGVKILFGEPMARYTTYKTGGPAEALALPQNTPQLKEVIALAEAQNIPWRVLGLGSNILVSDKGLKGITICLKEMRGIEARGSILTAQAGEPLDNLAAAAAERGFEGLEDLSGIPGSIGGAVFMNAGAYNRETFDFITEFTVLDCKTGQIKTLQKGDVNPKYRKVEGIENCIVLSASWGLKPAVDIEALKSRRREILAKRAEKQPLEFPSAGSVFKRPQGNYASALIDKCGLKGLRVGGAMVSPKHAGFIVNYDKATAADIKELIRQVQAKVMEKTGINLELEQIIWEDC